MERYQKKRTKKSESKRLNNWADIVGKSVLHPGLLLSELQVSVETLDIVNRFPVLTFKEPVEDIPLDDSIL